MAHKYIIIEVSGIEVSGIEVPILFPDIIKHDVHTLNSNHKVVSAGFCAVYANKDGTFEASCAGKSLSLNVNSRPEDSSIVEHMLNRKS